MVSGGHLPDPSIVDRMAAGVDGAEVLSSALLGAGFQLCPVEIVGVSGETRQGVMLALLVKPARTPDMPTELPKFTLNVFVRNDMAVDLAAHLTDMVHKSGWCPCDA